MGGFFVVVPQTDEAKGARMDRYGTLIQYAEAASDGEVVFLLGHCGCVNGIL